MRQETTVEVLCVRADSHVCFRPLFFRPPPRLEEDWIVGHELSDTTIALPASGIIAIQQLQQGKSIAEAAEAICQECDEEIDVPDLVEGLAALGLVASIDGYVTDEPEAIGHRWLGSIPSSTVAWLYSRPALLIFGILIIAGPIILLLDSTTRPQMQNFLWSPSYAVDTLVFLFLGPALVFKHELGHLLAARAKGLAAELTFGHRLFYLVAVSRIAGIWKLPRRDRMLIYGAGMGSDCVVASICSFILFAANQHLFALGSELRGLLGLIIISEYVGVVWEFEIFLKTDVYHIMADLTGQHDLPERASALLAALWRRIAGIPHRKDRVTPPFAHDWLTIGYTLLAVIGIGGSFIWLFFYIVPATISAIEGEVALLSVGLHAGNILALIDGVVALASQFTIFFLLGWSFFRTYRDRWHR